MKNDLLRKVWNKRADLHLNRKQCQTRDKFSEFYNESWWQFISPCLSEISTGRILEAGCGTGRWAERLSRMGFDVVLSDISPKMLQNARKLAEKSDFAHKLSFEELDICEMPSLQKNSFDMVLSTGEPLTLCASPEKAVSEFCRVVRPGGYVLCDAGNRYRKGLDLFNEKKFHQAMKVLETGKYTGESELTHHLLGVEELAKLFETNQMEVCHIAGITPLYSFPPHGDLKGALDKEKVFCSMLEISKDHAERPGITHLSSRLLAVARKPHHRA